MHWPPKFFFNCRCCDELRCTDCDFRIEVFDNFDWHPSTDYLFLRNNMPDRAKLKAKLKKKTGKNNFIIKICYKIFISFQLNSMCIATICCSPPILTLLLNVTFFSLYL